MKKIIVLGAIILVLLMTSSAAAVPNVLGAESVENINSNGNLTSLFEKVLANIKLMNLDLAEIIAILAGVIGFIFGVVTWLPYIVYTGMECLSDVVLTLLFTPLIIIVWTAAFKSEGYSFISAFLNAIQDTIDKIFIPMFQDIGDLISTWITYPVGMAFLAYLIVLLILSEPGYSL